MAQLACLPLGCSTSSGTSFVLFPEGHRLIDSARAVRSAMTAPLPLPRELNKTVTGPYVVEPGDVLLAQPASLDSPVRLPGDQTVLQDGTIQLGRYGRYPVAGKVIEQIEAEVNALVRAKEAETNPDVRSGKVTVGPITVRLVNRDSKVYYVLGEVNAPGAFQVKGRETVLDAIVAAGGLNNNASRRNIILARPTPPNSCRVVLPICYNEIVQLGDTATNYQILAGDRVFVPSRTCRENLMFWKREECPPCGAPQAPCELGAPVCEAGWAGRPSTPPLTVPLPSGGMSPPHRLEEQRHAHDDQSAVNVDQERTVVHPPIGEPAQ
jgi:protein involved in polysaccharide export with SLBB domain